MIGEGTVIGIVFGILVSVGSSTTYLTSIFIKNDDGSGFGTFVIGTLLYISISIGFALAQMADYLLIFLLTTLLVYLISILTGLCVFPYSIYALDVISERITYRSVRSFISLSKTAIIGLSSFVFGLAKTVVNSFKEDIRLLRNLSSSELREMNEEILEEISEE